VTATNKTLSARTLSISFVIFVFTTNIIDIKYTIVNFHYVQTSDNNNGFSSCNVSPKL